MDNTITIEGNLTKDPEVKTISTTSQVVRVSLAHERFFKDREGNAKCHTSFFDIEAWNGKGATIAKFKKGNRLKISGHLNQERWTDDAGLNHSRVRVVATHVHLPLPQDVAHAMPT